MRLQAIAAGREQELRSLIWSDPGSVLAAALPDDIRDMLPADVRDLVEQHISLEGVLELSIEDGPTSRTRYVLRTGGKSLELHFAGEAPAGLQTGTTLQVEGIQLHEDLALSASSAHMPAGAVAAATSILPNTFGAQQTLVILMNFQDLATQPYTSASVYDTTFTSVSNFYRNSSFQQTWLTGDVAGWYTIPVSSTTCNTSSIQSYAQQAAQSAGYLLSNYTHFVYLFPNITACTWAGYSYIGGTPSSSWINGNYGLRVVAHELGHAFGLYHSHSLSCGTAVYATSGCTVSEYGDTWDTMGGTYPDDFNASQKERLGWLDSTGEPPITTVATSGTYSLAPYEVQDTMVKALKIAGPSGSYYYLESRQAAGNDSNLAGNPNVLGGILLHNSTPGSPNTSYLLNATPGGSWSYPALTVGKSYSDSAMGFTITPLAVSSTGASVQVTYGPVTCTLANPSLSVGAPSSSVSAGASASFAITLTNNDSSVCSSSTFGLGYSIPAGWTAAYSASSVTLSPGASVSVTLQVTAPAGTPNGTYAVSVNGTNLSAVAYTASASSTLTIFTPLPASLAVSTNQATYTALQKVAINVTVMSGTVPASGVSVTVNISKASGAVVSATGTTGTNGVAVITYQVKKNDPKGMWAVTASSGSVSGTANFAVQ